MPGESEKKPAKESTSQKAAAKRATPKKPNAVRSPPARRLDVKPEDATQSRAWRKSVRGATAMIGDDSRLRELARRAGEKLDGDQLGRLSELVAGVRTLIRLVRAYVRDDYRQVSMDNLILVVAGLIYLVSPVDLIPDVLGPLGLADDAVVLRFVLKMVAEEVRRFEAWEAQGESSDTTAP